MRDNAGRKEQETDYSSPAIHGEEREREKQYQQSKRPEYPWRRVGKQIEESSAECVPEEQRKQWCSYSEDERQPNANRSRLKPLAIGSGKDVHVLSLSRKLSDAGASPRSLKRMVRRSLAASAVSAMHTHNPLSERTATLKCRRASAPAKDESDAM